MPAGLLVIVPSPVAVTVRVWAPRVLVKVQLTSPSGMVRLPLVAAPEGPPLSQT